MPPPRPPAPGRPRATSTDQAMEATMQSLAGATLVGGPATAAERALETVYLVDSDDDAETTSTAIDDFERRLAAREAGVQQQAPPSAAPPPTNSASRATKPVPQHLLSLLDEQPKR